MMEEDFKQLPVGSNDQLYHILKTDAFTFCLICLEDIHSTTDGVERHLTSANHTESIKRLLKACNPNLLDEIENERYADIVSKSVFDISVLLRENTCYVSKKDGFWFCLMCEKNIIESNETDAIIKDDIIDHILSDSHVQNVKEVCFLYKYNANQDFLLLNKSVVYCSVCKDVLQCKELDLLKTAVVHLEMKNLNHAMANSFQFEDSIIVNNEDSKMTEQGFVDERMPGDLNTRNISRTEIAGDVKDEHFDELGVSTVSSVEIVKDISMHINVPNQKDDKQLSKRKSYRTKINFWVCLCCKMRVKLMSGQSYIFSLIEHFRKSHRNIYIMTPFKDLINFVTFHNDLVKIKLIVKLRKINQDFLKLIKTKFDIKGHAKYILKTTTDYVCMLCMVSMSPCLDDNVVLLKRCQDHFNSSIHHQCEEEHIKLRKAFKINMKTNMKTKAMKKLTEQKSKLKKNVKKERELKKERRANKKKLKKLNKDKISLIKLEVPTVGLKPVSEQQVKTEID